MATVTSDVSSGTATRFDSMILSRTKAIECAGSPATTESRAMIAMSKGDEIVDVIVDADALGANTSYSVGYSLGGTITDDDAFILTTTSTSATRASLNALTDVTSLAKGRGYVFSADGTVDITAVGSGAWTGSVRVTVLFKRTAA
ncbi:MAG: hypothetical protein KF889_04885 [Alphaproteobacteria bacterium]|nr:hypothetical protein [Alphaproteobacteria bacterium]MCW5742204.1 hypothetical protein [Alphaproteobacteria bacterium]